MSEARKLLKDHDLEIWTESRRVGELQAVRPAKKLVPNASLSAPFGYFGRGGCGSASRAARSLANLR
jgi:hypothetical protein